MMRFAELAIAVALSLGILVAPADAAETFQFDTTKYSQEPTGCDRLASHGDDPFHVAPGLEKAQMDLPAAIAACEVAVARDPENPRLRYQLGRVYGYSGQGEKAGVHREAAVAADYPQALFVIGYLHLEGLNKAPKDVCRAAELVRRSAQFGRISGQIGYPMWVMEGRFKDCKAPQDKAEMLAFLDAAAAQSSDFYHQSAVKLLKQDLAAWQAPKS